MDGATTYVVAFPDGTQKVLTGTFDTFEDRGKTFPSIKTGRGEGMLFAPLCEIREQATGLPVWPKIGSVIS